MTSTVDAYPLVTMVNEAGRHSVATSSGLAPSRVVLVRLEDSMESLIAAIKERQHGGGCIGIVRNTVARAQQTATELRAAFEADVVLVHSRFLAVDRLAREAHLRDLLGPPGEARERPEALVVVGTQVLEQSLDVDFDLLITDLAPVDLILQRIGRLHRHTRPSRPARMSTPTCLITGCDWASDPPVAVKGSEGIYGRAKLWRALGALDRSWDQGIALPQDLPGLVCAAYDPDVVPGPAAWQGLIVEADVSDRRRVHKSIVRASTFLLGEAHGHGLDTIAGWTKDHVGEAREDTVGAAQVRDSEDGIEVIAVQQRDSRLFVMPGQHPGAGVEVPRDAVPDPAQARRLAGYTLRLPSEIARGRHGDTVIAHLERTSPAAWQQSYWLRGQLVLTFTSDLTADIGDYHLRYDPDQGLLHTRREPA